MNILKSQQVKKHIKRVRLYFLFLLSLIFSLFQGCKDKSHPPTIYITPETKDFCSFKPGTWWVYRNTQSNALDTWKVYKYEESVALGGRHRAENYEFNNLYISTNLHDTFELYIENGSLDFFTRDFFGILQPAYFENGTDKGGGCDNNYIKLMRRDTIGGIVHKEFQLFPSPCTNYFPNHTRWKRYTGLIEFSHLKGVTFKIVSSKIIQ